ncbi:centrosomal protein of 162 kDa-like [Anneissia japonica]|uniref:centrosomal protein of 162 kDa-like n=1 Tax=Anneissia japonica TaxID=1529436 RepID=UPI001425B846|nr:centrosomal protein of 162 kDa-like [Anneissia japonica]
MSKKKSQKWSKKDLDSAFEKFLQESVSDDSFDADRYHENSSKVKEDLPWWMKEGEQEKGTPTGASKWLKPKKQSTPLKEEEHDEPQEAKPKQLVKTGRPRGDAEVAMSRDSLEDGHKIANNAKQSDVESRSESFDESLSNTGEEFGDHMLASTGPERGYLSSTGPGIDTLAEIADKEQFFKDLEEKNDGKTIDFSKLNAESDVTGTLNMTGKTRLPSENTVHAKNREDFSERLASPNSNIEEYSPEIKSNKRPKSSMLSKVALLDTAESTLNVGKQEDSKWPSGDGTKSAVSSKTTASQRKMQPESQDLLDAGTGTELEALHAALRKARGDVLSDGTKGHGSETEEDDDDDSIVETKDPNARTVDDILREVQEERQRHLASNLSDDEFRTSVDGRGEHGPAYRSQFNANRSLDLDSNPERDNSTSNRGLGNQLATEDEDNNRGFSLQPATRNETDNRGFSLQPATKKETDNRGFSLQPATQHEDVDRGFSLQSATQHEDVGRGFSLQPALKENDAHGFSLRPASHVPSSDRFFTASADDEDSFNRLPSPSKPQNRGTKGKYSHVKSSGYGPPKLTSQAAWSPAQVAKHKIKGSESANRTGRTRAGDKNLVQSVESFAHYIQDHFSRGKKSPPPEWSNNEPNLSASLKDSKIQIISRERALVAEVAEWQQRWKEEQRQNWKLKSEIASKEREFARKMEESKLHHEKELFKLKQDNFVLQAKVNSEEEQEKMKKRLASGKSVDEISKEEVKLLHKEVIEQETLLQGYQQENERLYSEVKKYQHITKETEERLFKENQKLNTDIGNLREQLERKELALRHKGIITSDRAQKDIKAGATAVLGAGRIAQLEAEAVEAKIVEAELKQRIRQLEEGEREVKNHIELMVRERNLAQETIKAMKDEKINEFQALQKTYDGEVDKLKKKLKWYAENQDLLDKDYQSLKEKDEQLKMLRDELENYRKEKSQKSTETQRRAQERAADARRIQDLQRQVKEMEEIIKKRYPNSLPALIYAAASAPGQAQDKDAPKAKSHTMSYLEGRVHKLEEELEEKDEEAKRGLRVMEQKFNNVKIQYEERIKTLENQLFQYTANPASTTSRPHTSVMVLQKELQSVKERHKTKIQSMQEEMELMQKKLAGKKETSNKTEPYKTIGVQPNQVQLKQLTSELEEKTHEMELLKATCEKLMMERVATMTTNTGPTKSPSGSKRGKKSGTQPDESRAKVYHPDNFAGLHISEVVQENDRLKQECNRLSLEMEQQRLKLQASLAESEGAIRRIKEEKAEEIARLKSDQKSEIERLISNAAVNNSESANSKLRSKVETQEVTIRHLQQQLSSSRISADALAVAKIQEETLKVQVEQLTTELQEAKACHSPEMKHFEALQAKIVAMENRRFDREKEMKILMERTQETLLAEANQQLANYKQLLLSKNTELQRFRAELDSILEVLKELHNQGVILPTMPSKTTSLLR